MLTHGSFDILRHFQGACHFPKDQSMRLESPGWRVLELDEKPFSDEELDR